MYTYIPHWGLSLVASRGATRSTHFSFPAASFTQYSFVYSCVYSFTHRAVLLRVSLCHSVAPVAPKSWDWKADGLCGKKIRILPTFSLSLFLSLFYFRPGIPCSLCFIPSGPLSSLVECPTRRCLGELGDRRYEGVEIRKRGPRVNEEGRWRRGQRGDRVRRWHVTMWIQSNE